MKLCKDCKHARPVPRWKILGWGDTRWQFGKCGHQNLSNPVNGTPIDSFDFARSRPPCGPEGKLWEPRP